MSLRDEIIKDRIHDMLVIFGMIGRKMQERDKGEKKGTRHKA